MDDDSSDDSSDDYSDDYSDNEHSANYRESKKIEIALIGIVTKNENPTDLSWETIKAKVSPGVLMSAACYTGNGPMAYSELLTIMDNDDTVATKLLESGLHFGIYDSRTNWRDEIGTKTPSEFFHLCAKKHDEFN